MHTNCSVTQKALKYCSYEHIGHIVFFVLFGILHSALFYAIWNVLGQPAFPWDAGWYRSVVEHGYSFNGNIFEQQNVAFLPGFPGLILLVKHVFGLDSANAQMIAALFGGIAGTLFLGLTVANKFGFKCAAFTIFFMIANPFSIYLYNGYSESLFYFLTCLFLWLLTKEKFYSCAIIAGLGLITRPYSALLVFSLFFSLTAHFCKDGKIAGSFFGRIHPIFQKKWDFLTITNITILFPFGVSVYWLVVFEDPFLYFNALSAWDRSASWGGLLNSKAILQHDIFKGILISYPSPSFFAVFLLVMNGWAAAFLLHQKDLLLALLTAGWLCLATVISTPADIGRHLICSVGLPIALGILVKNSLEIEAATIKLSLTSTLRRVLIWVFSGVYAIAGLFLYLNYAAIQMTGGWIS